MTRMPVELARRYGRSDFYTDGQIAATLQVGTFGLAYDDYAFALFLRPEDAANYFESEAAAQKIRDDISDMFPAYAGKKVTSAFALRMGLTDPREVGDYGSDGTGGSDSGDGGDG